MPETPARPRETTPGNLPPSLPAAPPACANCGLALAGPFCSNCGQHVADFHRSLWRFFTDFLNDAVCWDNKLFRTLEPLLKYPGLLTEDFMVGRRVRYVHPLRLFIFTSAVCLALLQYSHDNLATFNVSDKPGKSNGHLHVKFDRFPAGEPTPAPTAAVESSPPGEDQAGRESKPSDDELGDTIRAAVADKLDKQLKTPGEKDDDLGGQLNQMVQEKIKRAGGAERFSRKMAENFQNKLSWVALVLLPVFALGLRVLYWRGESYYFAHLIFSLHYHTFLLLFWTAYTCLLAVDAFLPLHSLWEFLARFCLLWPPVYLYLALQRLYQGERKRTIVKVIVLGSLHLLAILIGVGAVGAMAFFTTGD